MGELPLVDIIPPAAAWAESSSSPALAWAMGVSATLLTLLVWMAWLRRKPAYRLRRLVRKTLACAQTPYDKATIVARATRLFVARESAPKRLERALEPLVLQLDHERFKAAPDGERVHGILWEMHTSLQRRPPE